MSSARNVEDDPNWADSLEPVPEVRLSQIDVFDNVNKSENTQRRKKYYSCLLNVAARRATENSSGQMWCTLQNESYLAQKNALRKMEVTSSVTITSYTTARN